MWFLSRNLRSAVLSLDTDPVLTIDISTRVSQVGRADSPNYLLSDELCKHGRTMKNVISPHSAISYNIPSYIAHATYKTELINCMRIVDACLTLEP